MSEIEEEIEKLKMKKIELVSKINLTTDFDEKEELQQQVERIQNQIDTLEKFKKKSSTHISSYN